MNRLLQQRLQRHGQFPQVSDARGRSRPTRPNAPIQPMTDAPPRFVGAAGVPSFDANTAPESAREIVNALMANALFDQYSGEQISLESTRADENDTNDWDDSTQVNASPTEVLTASRGQISLEEVGSAPSNLASRGDETSVPTMPSSLPTSAESLKPSIASSDQSGLSDDSLASNPNSNTSASPNQITRASDERPELRATREPPVTQERFTQSRPLATNLSNTEMLSAVTEQPSAASVESTPFQRREAMRELRELGVKVNATLSNSALQAQLEAVRDARLEAKPLSGDVSASNSQPTSSRTEVRDVTDSGAHPEPQLESSSDTAPRSLEESTEPDADLSNLETARHEPQTLETGTFETITLETAAFETRPELEAGPQLPSSAVNPESSPRAALSQALAQADERTTLQSTVLETVAKPSESDSPEPKNPQPSTSDLEPSQQALSAAVRRSLEAMAQLNPSMATSKPNEVAPVTTDPSSRVPTFDAPVSLPQGSVTSVETYNPPNRRAAPPKPKVEAVKSEADKLFESVPDSNPLEWLSLLNAVNAFDENAPLRPASVPVPTAGMPINAQILRDNAPNPERLVAPLVPGTQTPNLLPASQTNPTRASLASNAKETRPANGARDTSASPDLAAAQLREKNEASAATKTDALGSEESEAVSTVLTEVTANLAQLESAEERAASLMASELQSEPQDPTAVDRAGAIPADDSRTETTSGFDVTSDLPLEAVSQLTAPLESEGLNQTSVLPSREITSERTETTNAPDTALPKNPTEPRAPNSDSASSPRVDTTERLEPVVNEASFVQAPSAAPDSSQFVAPTFDAPVSLPQGSVTSVETYNPPNRRAAPPKPKVEAVKSEADKLFESVPESNPLEWLSLLNAVNAFDENAPLRPENAATRMASQNAFASTEPTAVGQASPPVVPGGIVPKRAVSADLRASSSVNADDPAFNPSSPTVSSQNTPLGTSLGSSALESFAPESAASRAPLVAPPLASADRIEARDASPQRAQPVQLSDNARQLLRPLTGIDPSEVRIHRDASSEAATRAYGADALAVGESVLLSTRMTGESPETLGVIAHELTHVARNRQPRFVPAALQPRAASSASVGALGEEEIALQVEGQVRAIAQSGVAQSGAAPYSAAQNSAAQNSRVQPGTPISTTPRDANTSLSSQLAAQLERAFDASGQPVGAPMFPSGSSPTSSFAPPVRGSNPSSSSVSQSNVSQSGFSQTSFVAPSSYSGGNTASLGVQAAAQGRDVPAAPPPPSGPLPQRPEASAAPTGGAAPKQDLDDLARQIYAILKHRLITERRRLP